MGTGQVGRPLQRNGYSGRASVQKDLSLWAFAKDKNNKRKEGVKDMGEKEAAPPPDAEPRIKLGEKTERFSTPNRNIAEPVLYTGNLGILSEEFHQEKGKNKTMRRGGKSEPKKRSKKVESLPTTTRRFLRKGTERSRKLGAGYLGYFLWDPILRRITGIH